MNKKLLRSRIISITILIVISMFLIQILPAIICHFGMNILPATILLSCITILFSLVFVHKTVKEPISFNTPKPVVVVVSVIVTLLFLAIDQTLVLWIGAHIPDAGMEARAATIGSIDLERYWMLYLFYGIILAPVAEECLFRIALYRYLKKSFSWMTALVMSSIMFGFIHMTIAHLVTGTLFAMLLTLIMERTKCVWITIVCHIAYNLGTLFVSGNEMALLAGNTVITILLFFAVLFLLCIGMVKQDVRMNHTK